MGPPQRSTLHRDSRRTVPSIDWLIVGAGVDLLRQTCLARRLRRSRAAGRHQILDRRPRPALSKRLTESGFLRLIDRRLVEDRLLLACRVQAWAVLVDAHVYVVVAQPQVDGGPA